MVHDALPPLSSYFLLNPSLKKLMLVPSFPFCDKISLGEGEMDDILLTTTTKPSIPPGFNPTSPHHLIQM